MNKSQLQINEALYHPLFNDMKLLGYSENTATIIASQISGYYARAIAKDLDHFRNQSACVLPNTTK